MSVEDEKEVLVVEVKPRSVDGEENLLCEIRKEK